MIVCGTGHRPQHLPCGFDENHPWKIDVEKHLKSWIEENKPTEIISGMALGWDTWLAEAAVECNIPLSAYVPFVNQSIRWNEQFKNRYKNILAKATKVLIVCEGGYASWKMMKRNQKMVEDSDQILALWDPSKLSGGTYNAIQSAESSNKPIVNFWKGKENV